MRKSPPELKAGRTLFIGATKKGKANFYEEVAKSAKGEYRTAMTQRNYCVLQNKKCANRNAVGCWLKDSPMYEHITRGNAASEYTLDVASQGRVIAAEGSAMFLLIPTLIFL